MSRIKSYIKYFKASESILVLFIRKKSEELKKNHYGYYYTNWSDLGTSWDRKTVMSVVIQKTA